MSEVLIEGARSVVTTSTDTQEARKLSNPLRKPTDSITGELVVSETWTEKIESHCQNTSIMHFCRQLRISCVNPHVSNQLAKPKLTEFYLNQIRHNYFLCGVIHEAVAWIFCTVTWGIWSVGRVKHCSSTINEISTTWCMQVLLLITHLASPQTSNFALALEIFLISHQLFLNFYIGFMNHRYEVRRLHWIISCLLWQL